MVRHCWFIVLTIILGGYVFCFVDQGQDVMRTISDDQLRLSLCLLATFWWGVQTWYGARTVLNLTTIEGIRPAWSERLQTWIPRFMGSLPCLIMAAAMYRSAQGLSGGAAACVLLAVLVPVVAFLRRKWRHRRLLEVRQWKHVLSWRSLIRDYKFAWVSFALFMGLMVTSFASPVHFPQSMGAAFVVISAFGCWIAASYIVVFLDKWIELPLVGMVLLSTLLFSRWNNNHEVRLISETPVVIPTPRPTVAAHFEDWLGSRPSHPSGERYPVFLVTAEGGGIRSAYWVAGALGAIQDELPTFKDHVYAISGVSGGSLGGAVYAALVSSDADAGTYRASAKDILKRDFLSPVAFGMCYPDLLQRFWFVAHGKLDRSRFLEKSWEAAWSSSEGGDQFGRPFESLWSEGSAPLLLLNGTHVEKGGRVVVAPVRIGTTEDKRADLLANPRLQGKLRLSTAVLLSARFPYVTPAAAMPDGNGEVWGHVADGGYFENSGAATALDVLSKLKPFEEQGLADVHVLVLTNQPRSKADKVMKWLNEVREPVKALMASREARVPYSIDLLERTIGRDHTIRLNMDRSMHVVPLGWYLSDSAKEALDTYIEEHVPDCAQEIKEVIGNRAAGI
ncbi:patatin-like phospholipase family protein [Candidatus Latescibacterota bacterium]